jgi:RNA polymerase sigma-70 factor (ECF subfamily)
MLFNDKHYIDLLKNGDEKAFEALFRLYYKPLFNYARELLKDTYQAEEAIEEVFVKLWENRHSIQIEHSLKSYLFKSTFNYCLNSLKHRIVEDKYKSFFLHHMPLGTANEVLSDDFPLSKLLGSELEELIAKAVESLPDQCRQVFIMSRYQNMKHDEISRELNISVNTVRTHIARALQKLRIELKDYLPLILGLIPF